MKVFHIVEETTDQQTVEIKAGDLGEALSLYLAHNTHEVADSMQVLPPHRVVYGFSSEVCTFTITGNGVLFAKWTDKRK